MLWTDEVWIFDLVAAQFLAPIDLLLLSQVSKELNTICRQDRVWKRHKDRVIKYMPKIGKFLNDETWISFVQILMTNPFSIRRKKICALRDERDVAAVVLKYILKPIKDKHYLFWPTLKHDGYLEFEFMYFTDDDNLLAKTINTDFIKENYHKIPDICAATYFRFDINDLVVPYQCVVFDDMRHYDFWLNKLQRYIHNYWENCETNNW